LILSSLALAIRIFKGFGMFEETTSILHHPKTMRFWIAALGVGLITGLLSGLFGIGSTPFIQIGLLTFFGITVKDASGTTMLYILSISLLGSLGYCSLAFIDIKIFLEVVGGTMIGSYIGANFTARLHPTILKVSMVGVPAAGAIL